MFGKLKSAGRAICTSVAVLAAGAVFATDYEWVNATDRSANWDDVANWNVGGEVATSQPLTADDAATFPSTTAFLQTISWDAGIWSPGNAHTVKAVSGGAGAQLSFATRDGQITIANPNGFAGVFRQNQARGILQSTSSADFTPTFKAVNARNWTKINNLGAEGKMVVESAFGEGRVSVNAGYNANDETTVASTVEIGETGGFPQEAKVNKGTVVFKGGTKSPAPAVAAGAWMHLDASAAGSIELDADGKVTKWNDVRNNGVYAGQYLPTWATSAFSRPTVVSNWANGLPAVDFGLYSGTRSGIEGGSSYAGAEWFSNNLRAGNPSALAWSERRTDIKEVYFVFSDTSSTNYPAGVGNSVPYIIGDGEQDPFARGDTGTLFANNTAFDMRATLNGEVRVNGHRVSYDHADNYAYRPFVVSVRGAGDLSGALFGASGRVCRNDVNRDLHLGGIRLAEVLVYTNALTDAQRAATERYLMEKWCSDEVIEQARQDLALLDLSIKNTQAKVEGGTFTVGELMLPADAKSYTKTGSGTLEVGKMPAACTSLAIEEGGFALRQRLNPAPDASKGPAADPQVWLDATKTDSFAYDENGKVVRWNDWRTNLTRKRAYSMSNFETPVNLPTRNADDADHPYVDFGPYLGNLESAAQVVKDYDGRTLEAFVVYRNHQDMSVNYPFAGDGFIVSDDESRLQAMWYNSADQLSATFRQNGVTLNTELATVDAATMKSFGVYSVRLPGGCNMKYVGCDRGAYAATLFGGGCDIAEILYYDRRLTDAERSNTEAYLMNKWLGKEHPDCTRLTSLASVTFAEGVEPTIGSDEPLAIGSVRGAGDFVKTGTGDVNVGKVSGFAGLAVEGGSLTAEEDMFGDAYFHVDASVSESLVMVKGSTTREIAQWNDVRGNGRYAKSVVENLGNNEQLLKYPRLNDEAGPGWAEGMPTVDFLGYARPADYGIIDCACMHWYDENGSHDGSMDIREVHIVYCENGLDGTAGYNPGGSWMGYAGGGSYASKYGDITYQFLRDGIGLLIIPWYSRVAGYAEMRIDGEHIVNYSQTSSYYVANKAENKHFHVLSLAGAEGMQANFFCNDRGNCGAGGYRIAEVVVFTGNTNSYEKFQAINDHLCKKWRDIGEGGSYTKLASLRATGGTLNLSSATGAVAPKDGANLEFAFKDADDYGKIEIDGDFVVPENGTISVTLPQRGQPRPEPGEYVLLQADNFVGAENFANWTVSAETNGRFTADIRIDAENGRIVLTISKFGSAIILR